MNFKLSEIKEMLKEIAVEEGVGPVYTKDIKKDPKHIDDPDTGKPERWRIKFQSASDLEKHGDTEKSPVNETLEPHGRTPMEPMQVADLILGMSGGESVLFFSNNGNRGPMVRIVRRPAQAGQQVQAEFVFDVEDQKKHKQVITRQSQVEKLADIIVQQKLTRYMGGFQSPTYPRSKGAGPISNSQAKSQGGMSAGQTQQLKEVIKELVNEMWIGFEEDKQREFMDNEKEAVNPMKAAKVLNKNVEKGITKKSDIRKLGVKVNEVRMPHSQPTPKDTKELWQLVDQLAAGQSINFYNPNNPNHNTTAPWVYIKKIDTHDSGGHESYGFNLSIEPRMDAGSNSGVLRMDNRVETGDDVTEDEVSLALEVVAENIGILSMYYVETEEAPRKRKPYQGDPDHDIGDYERFGADEKRPDSSYVEGKSAMNEKRQYLRNIIREAITEVQSEMHDFEERQELNLLKQIQSAAHWLVAHPEAQGKDVQQAATLIKSRVDELVKSHEHGHEVPIKKIREEAPAGWEGTVKAMKKHKDIDNPWALAHWMKNKGMKSHK